MLDSRLTVSTHVSCLSFVPFPAETAANGQAVSHLWRCLYIGTGVCPLQAGLLQLATVCEASLMPLMPYHFGKSGSTFCEMFEMQSIPWIHTILPGVCAVFETIPFPWLDSDVAICFEWRFRFISVRWHFVVDTQCLVNCYVWSTGESGRPSQLGWLLDAL